MQVSVEVMGGLQRRVTVQVPSDEVEREITERLKSLRTRVKIAGFRPGKVPMDVVTQRYQGQVRTEVLEALIQKTFHDALTQEKLRPAGGPRIEPKNTTPGQSFEYSAVFEVYPEVVLYPIEDAEIERISASVTDTDIERMLEKLQTQRVIWEAVDRPAQLEDQLIVSFVGTLNGETFAGGTAEHVPLVLGADYDRIPGFADQLLGACVAEERRVEVTFPSDDRNTELAGKNVTFTTKVESINQPKLPEINEEFARSFGIGNGSLQALREDIRSNMERELKDKIRQDTKQKIMDLLIQRHDLELPVALIEGEMGALKKHYIKQRPGITEDQIPLDSLRQEASRRVKLGLLVGELIRIHNLNARRERVDEILASIASTYDSPEQVIQTYRNSQKAMQTLEGLALEEEVVDFLMGRVKVRDKNLTFTEVLKQN